MILLESVSEKKILLVAHRGVCGGNIPCNSLQAFSLALKQGADVVELDVEASVDGELFVQHPGMERVHLRTDRSLRTMTASEIEGIRLSNCDHTPTQWCIPRLEEALLFLRGKCVVNIDKFWCNPEPIAAMVRKLGMEEQVLIKTEPRPEYLDAVEKYAPDLYYMSVVREDDTVHEQLKCRDINYIGAEVLFSSEDAPVASREYIDMLHRDGKLVWVNSIVYDYADVLSAGHTDDISVLEDPELGWGWLADRGFDLIQTDFLHLCREFLERTGRRPPSR